MILNWIFVFYAYINNVRTQSPIDYPTRVPGNCSGITLFDCGGGVCIPFQLVRNCERDCANGADEECGTNQISCDATIGSGCGKCVASSDASTLCLDRRYIRICEQGVSATTNSPIFVCTGTPNCVPMDWVNDGTNDCGDWSDEDPCMRGYNCTQKQIAAPTQLTFCTCKGGVAGNGTIWQANDPLFRQRVPGACNNDPLQFDCGTTCIDMNLVRNCVRDCPNGADETCWAGTVLCPDGCTCLPASQNASCANFPSTIRATTITISTTGPTTITSTVTIPTTTASTSFSGSTNTMVPTTATSSLTLTSSTQSSTSLSQTATTAISTVTSNITSSTSTNAVNSSIMTTVSITRSTSVIPSTTSKPSAPCTIAQFRCQSGQCVNDLNVLDGKSDCADNSDENCTLSCTGVQVCFYVPQNHNFSCGCPSGTTPTNDRFCLPLVANQQRDCSDLGLLAFKNNFNLPSGVYSVYKANCVANDRTCLIPCACDMDTDNGGYTIIQQRTSPSTDFFRSWEEYKNGFNLGQTDFWQGNEYLYALTNRPGAAGLFEALVLLTLANGTKLRTKYNQFKVGSESENYKLILGSPMSGSDNDNLANDRNRNFATFDKDTKSLTGTSCASYWHSGWWFDSLCRDVGNLNMPLAYDPKFPYLKGVAWPGPLQQVRNVTGTSMLIRSTSYLSNRQQQLTTTISIIPRTGQNAGNQLQTTFNKCLLLTFKVLLFLIYRVL